jgi:adenylate cyclase
MPRKQPTRKLSAVVVADIAGYSGLMESDESGTWARVAAIQDEIVEPAVTRFHGRIVKTTGDGWLAEFASITEAVKCVLQIQNRMAEMNDGIESGERLEFRIGVNLGEVIHEADDIFGTGVNVAARLQSLARPGGICVSGVVHDEIRGEGDLSFEDMGAQKVKSMAKPVRCFSVRPAADTGAPMLELPDHEAPGASIAVLPFDNFSNEPDQEYFADGMVEDIITALSRFKQIFVIARNSTFAYKKRAVDARQVARELGVHYVLEGSVRRAGPRLRITGQLIDATAGIHLWAERFDGTIEDVFEFQDRMTEKVVGAIEPRIRKAEIERARRKRPENLDAYDLYLQALPHAYAMRPADNTRALGLLEKAIQLDPGYAPAAAFAAWCYEQRLTRAWPASRADDAEKAKRLARTTLALDTDDANSIAIAGFVLVMIGREYESGLAALERAVELNPNSAFAAMLGGWAKNFAGDLTEAVADLERARRLSPADLTAFFVLTGLGMAHTLLGEYEEAAELATASAALYEDWDATYFVLAAASGHLGRLELARDSIARLQSLHPEASISGYLKYLPFKDPARPTTLHEGLRIAGLPA